MPKYVDNSVLNSLKNSEMVYIKKKLIPLHIVNYFRKVILQNLKVTIFKFFLEILN